MKGRAWAVGLALSFLLALAPAAAAQSPFTWTGAAATSAWSSPGNWARGVAPSGAVGTLRFPSLASSPCSPPSDACYASSNDVSGISAGALTINNGSPYVITGDAITLGAGGISSAGGSAGGTPILALSQLTLGAPQTWSVTGGAGGSFAGLNVEGTVTGPSESLGLGLSGNGNLGLSKDVEVGPVNAVGGDPASSGDNAFLNGSVELTGRLNATDGSPVTLTNSELDAFPPDSSGAAPATGSLRSVGGSIVVASQLNVDGDVTLDAASATTLFIFDTGRSVGKDFSQLSASGNMTLGGTLHVEHPLIGTGVFPCPLNPGQVYRLITATAAISGSFSNAPDGAIVPMGCGLYSAQIHYSTSSVTATVVGTRVSLAADRSAVSTNQPVTLTATVSQYPGTPSGFVEFDNHDLSSPGAIPGCAHQPVTASGSGYAATCQTSFRAAFSPAFVTATLLPSMGATDLPVAVLVNPDSTSTTVAASSPRSAAGSSVTYTATVTPADSGPVQPSGTVEFLDGSSPIPGCAGQPLSAGPSPSRATCTISATAAGSHLVSAIYSGDPNFNGSVSPGAPVAAIAATTDRATKVKTTRAVLNGSIDTGGSAVAWRFAYGPSPAHEKTTPLQTISAGQGIRHVSWTLTGLSPGTRYHVTLVVSSIAPPPALGRGQDRTFRTGTSGQLLLGARFVAVLGRSVSVPERCTSAQPCTGRLSIAIRAGTDKKPRTVLCAGGGYRIPAHRRRIVVARLSRGCLARLRRGAHHRLDAAFRSRPRSAQSGVIKPITLILQ